MVTTAMRYIGWLGNAALIAGAVLVGEKSPAAFVLIVVGETLWAVEAYRIRRRDMLCLCVVFGLLAVRNLVLWLK